MFRKITLFGVVLTLIVIVAGSLTRVMGVESLFGLIQLQDVHFKAAYVLAAVTLVVLLMSWWQAHCRAAAVMASFGPTGLLGLQVL
jgi:hypothetical protein